jgi:GNAT superfamily N-acetyltransferase
MTITVARPADLHDILEMLAEYQESLETVTVIDEHKNEKFVQGILDDGKSTTLFIGRTSTGQAAAFAIVYLRLYSADAATVPFVTDLFVRPAYRRKGFGRQFFDYLLRWAKTKKHDRIRWQVENLNLTGQYMFDTYNPEITGWVGYTLDLKKE